MVDGLGLFGAESYYGARGFQGSLRVYSANQKKLQQREKMVNTYYLINRYVIIFIKVKLMLDCK